jgi:hypothetical protein
MRWASMSHHGLVLVPKGTVAFGGWDVFQAFNFLEIKITDSPRRQQVGCLEFKWAFDVFQLSGVLEFTMEDTGGSPSAALFAARRAWSHRPSRIGWGVVEDAVQIFIIWIAVLGIHFGAGMRRLRAVRPGHTAIWIAGTLVPETPEAGWSNTPMWKPPSSRSTGFWGTSPTLWYSISRRAFDSKTVIQDSLSPARDGWE